MINAFRRLVGLVFDPHLGQGGAVVALGAGLVLGGCSNAPEAAAPDAVPSATYTGPEYLYNSIGSLAQIDNNREQLVSGYGLVVGLNGTGSSEVPQALRQWLINEMVKKGVGKTAYAGILPLGPEALLASEDTAVVRVVGLVPAGAVKGSRFDLLVTSVDSTTTSLVGGQLWTCDLSVGNANPEEFFLTPVAEGRGPIYLDPTVNAQPQANQVFELRPERRTALVVSGGEVLETQNFEIVLNQASRQRASIIADRINERYPKAPNDPLPTANAISPLVIQLNLPERFHDRPQEFVQLISHTYIDRNPSFVAYQSEELAKQLIENPSEYGAVVWAWKALGPNATKALRSYYPYERLDVRLAALEAGAYLKSEAASPHLLELAEHENTEVRKRVAEALVNLPQSINGGRALRTLLDDQDLSVRIAAYESLVAIDSGLIDSRAMYDENGRIKLIIDRVLVKEPLIYITQKNQPRLVIFNPNLGFEPGTLARIWNDRLMIRRGAAEDPAVLFYQYRDRDNGNQARTDQHDIMPTLATLAYILAHEPSVEDPQQGYRLTYGQVADAVYQLARSGAIDAQVEIDRGPLATLINRIENGDTPAAPERPETGSAPGTSPGTLPANAVGDSADVATVPNTAASR